MFKKFVIALGILLVIAFASEPISLSTNKVLAHSHGYKQHGCRDCGHYVCKGDCEKCEECLARETAEKCGHVDCPSNCDKCVDCLNERIRKLEKELQKEKE